jgi:aminopeptidase
MSFEPLFPDPTERRHYLKPAAMALLAIGVGLSLITGCATKVSKRIEPPPPPPPVLSPAELRNRAIDNLFKVNLGVKRDERVLVFTDDQNPVVTKEAQHVARRGAGFGEIIFFTYPRTTLPDAEPPKELWEKAFGNKIMELMEQKDLMKKLLQKRIDDQELQRAKDIVRANKNGVVAVVIAMAWHSTTHTNFQRLLTDSGGARFASMPAFNPSMLQTAMSADWEEVALRTVFLKTKLSGVTSAHIETPNGTDLFLDLRDREFLADTGLLNHPGRFGNLPGGELRVAPVEKRSRGRMVIDPGINPGVKGPIVFEIKDGRISKMNGGTGYSSWLESVFYKYPQGRIIAQFAIGTNDKAKIGITPQESEKVLGTIHIAIGDNSTIGGKNSVPLHLDFLFSNPTVEFTLSDGTPLALLKDGKVLL